MAIKGTTPALESALQDAKHKLGASASTGRKPRGRAIGMVEKWNIGKIGFGILAYWVNDPPKAEG
jgi:hypothetical protein